MRSWTVDEMMALGPCYTRDRNVRVCRVFIINEHSNNAPPMGRP